MNERMCWLRKGLQTPFNKRHKFQNCHLVSSRPSIVRVLNAGGMNIGSLGGTVTKRRNGYLPFAKRSPSNYFGRVGKDLVKRCSSSLVITSYKDTRWSFCEDADPMCRSCGEEEETSHHVIAECPAFAAIRLRVLGTLVLQGTFHWLKQIVKFLRKINFSSLQDQGVK